MRQYFHIEMIAKESFPMCFYIVEKLAHVASLLNIESFFSHGFCFPSPTANSRFSFIYIVGCIYCWFCSLNQHE
jgi:hypothetical protein